MIHVPTVFVLIIIISLSLGGAIWLTSSTEPGSGLKQLAYGLLLHGLAYVLFISSSRIGPFGIWVAEMSISAFFCMCLCAISMFHRSNFNRFVYIIPNLLVAVISAVFVGEIEERILLNSLVFMGIEAVFLSVVFRNFGATQGNGKYLVVFSVFLSLAMFSYREVGLLSGTGAIRRLYDGSLSQALIYLSALSGMIFLAIGFVLMAKERTDHRNREMISTDELTGVWNRRKLEEVGRAELLRHVRYGVPASLLMIDLDDFKAINDGFGHAAGDVVLARLAIVCGAELKDTDTLGRWGGEEFAVVLPGTGAEESLAIADRLRRVVCGIETDFGRPISASIGVSPCLSSDDWNAWFARADAALYRAKAAGKNRAFYEIPLVSEGGVTRILWSEAFETGVAALDEDHRALVSLVNELLRLLRKSYDKRHVSENLSNIDRKMRDHFIREEIFLGERFPGARASHHDKHGRMLERFEFLVERFEADVLPLEYLVEFIVFEMCAQHILIDDLKATD